MGFHVALSPGEPQAGLKLSSDNFVYQPLV